MMPYLKEDEIAINAKTPNASDDVEESLLEHKVCNQKTIDISSEFKKC